MRVPRAALGLGRLGHVPYPYGRCGFCYTRLYCYFRFTISYPDAASLPCLIYETTALYYDI